MFLLYRVEVKNVRLVMLRGCNNCARNFVSLFFCICVVTTHFVYTEKAAHIVSRCKYHNAAL